MSLLKTSGTVAAVIAAMAVGRVVTDHVPTNGVSDESLVYSGGVSETISMPYADVEVTDVRGAEQIDGVDSVRAAGEYLVVDLRLTATQHNVNINGIALHDRDGRIHLNQDRGSACALNASLRTSVTWYTRFCFDVPADALEGARLVVARGAWVNEGQRRDAVADVDLGIDAERAAQIVADTGVVEGFQGDFEPATEDGGL